MSVITFHLLSQPETRARLAEELKDVDLDNITWVALEKLPYLGAVITEGLRLSYGISGRTPRIAEQEHLVYRNRLKGQRGVEVVIPSGTAVDSE